MAKKSGEKYQAIIDVFGTLDESVTSWIMNDRKYDLMALVDPIHSLFIQGLNARP